MIKTTSSDFRLQSGFSLKIILAAYLNDDYISCEATPKKSTEHTEHTDSS